MFKVGDRRRVEAVLFEELGISDKAEYDKLPREIQLAGWRGACIVDVRSGGEHNVDPWAPPAAGRPPAPSHFTALGNGAC